MSSNNPVGYYGAHELTRDTDFMLGTFGGSLSLNKAPKTYFDQKVEYNQTDVDPFSCTIHAAMGAYTDLTGHEFTLEKRKALWKKALALGAVAGFGWNNSDAVDLIRREMDNVSSFRVSLLGEDATDALKRGYSLVVGFRGNKDYNKDRLDGTLDNVGFGSATYGHAVRMVRNGADLIIVDNYAGKPYNTYKIKLDNLLPLIKNGVFWESAYLYSKKLTENQAKLAKIKGLKVAQKILLSQSKRKLNDIEIELANLEGRPALMYRIEII